MIENSIVYRDFKGKYEYFPISRAEGSLIWDRDGKRFIDFTSGWNVTNLGWNHPEIKEAIVEQTNKNIQGLLWGSDPIQEEYAKVLTSALPKELNACVKENGGTESVEVSLKVARAYTNRNKIIGFKNSYHGQLFASLALGYLNDSNTKLAPLVPDIETIEFPDNNLGDKFFDKFLIDLEMLLSRENVAAVITEPGIITGWGSTKVAHNGFLEKVRELTKKYGTLLIVDEVGTGFSRTGKLFGIEHEQVTPDMIVLAKAISNGVSAIGTVVGNEKLFGPIFSEAILISTFGWTPIACASALKTLKIHQRDKTWEMAEQKGAFIIKKLKEQIGDKVVEVKGLGMEIGLTFKNSEICKIVQRSSFEQGLHVIVGSENNIQIMPPLTISQDLLDEGLDILIHNINIKV
jgi:putrescine aminotransferase